jgi:hypothetical protein
MSTQQYTGQKTICIVRALICVMLMALGITFGETLAGEGKQ